MKVKTINLGVFIYGRENYRSFTGLTEFYYKVHGEDVQAVTDPERIKYLQEISVSKDQDIEKQHMVITK